MMNAGTNAYAGSDEFRHQRRASPTIAPGENRLHSPPPKKQQQLWCLQEQQHLLRPQQMQQQPKERRHLNSYLNFDPTSAPNHRADYDVAYHALPYFQCRNPHPYPYPHPHPYQHELMKNPHPRWQLVQRYFNDGGGVDGGNYASHASQNGAHDHGERLSASPSTMSQLQMPSTSFFPTRYPRLVIQRNMTKTTQSKASATVKIGRLFVRMMPTNENGDDGPSFELGDFTIAIRYTDVESHVINRAMESMERLHRSEEKDATRRARTPWRRDFTTTSKKVGKVYEMGRDKMDVDEDQREEVNVVTRPIAAALRDQPPGGMRKPRLASFHITHTARCDDAVATTKTIWSTSPGVNFVGASSLSLVDVDASNCSNGNTEMMKERHSRIYNVQTIDSFVRHQGQLGGPAVTIMGNLGYDISAWGELLPSCDTPRYALTFSLSDKAYGCVRDNDGRGLEFELRVEGGGKDVADSVLHDARDDNESGSRSSQSVSPVASNCGVNSAHLFFAQNGGESYFGLGGRTSRPNLCGLKVQVCHPTIYGTTTVSSTNTSHSSSLTIPHFVSTSGVSLHLHNIEPTIFDFVHASAAASTAIGNATNKYDREHWYSIRSMSSAIRGTFLAGSSMLHACELHTGMVGRTRPLPKWTQRNGILAGVTGGTRTVNHVCKMSLFRHDVQVGGVLIKDWTGVKIKDPSGKNCGGGGGGRDNDSNNVAWYNWVLERDHYPLWQGLVNMLEQRGISVGLYLCPYLEEVPLPLRSGRRYLYGETNEDVFFVKRERKTKKKTMNCRAINSRNRMNGEETQTDEERTISMCNIFQRTKCGLLDPTNSAATTWFKRAVKEELMGYAGASFWLADMSMGGPPLDGVYTAPQTQSPTLLSGTATTTTAQGNVIVTGINASKAGMLTEVGLLLHNSYAEEWARVNHEAIVEAGREGDGFFIVNCAYGATSKYARSTSLSDHVVNFHRDNDTRNDSSGGILRSVLNGLLNGGFSGLTHGHCAVNLAVPRQLSTNDFIGVGNCNPGIDSLSREMICRWFELTAFTTLFRTHDGDCGLCDKNGNLISAYQDVKVMKSLARWSKVYVSLSEYRLHLMNEASARGFPVVRHPMLHFPNDAHFIENTSMDRRGRNGDASIAHSSAFMLGDSVYVVPILSKGVVRSNIYLPEGAWTHLWVRVFVKRIIYFAFMIDFSLRTYLSLYLFQRAEKK
ncbi:hypothetical protein ACHAXA_002868 [Cyclostephanos tholiformis]|uniref:Alpha-galactosidase n=1 Tax=Cyclostephanos tholiformis TaxID=382380 RepID=A0ABD3SBU9_9STRA